MSKRRGTDLTLRERKFVAGIALGSSQEEAARAAGYSDQTARKSAWAILDRPMVRSFLTVALQEAGLTHSQIVQPYLDALNANVIVTSSDKMQACRTDVPDHEKRMRAADRICQLFGAVPRAVEMPQMPSEGLTVNIYETDRSGHGNEGKPVPSQKGNNDGLRVNITLADAPDRDL